ncbi:MAG: class I SAM-dependent methyltransferase [Lachnospiraceae bacterium]|nr:class I SAM-dependent methyltransferase [Lachnospiraceae bacterium]
MSDNRIVNEANRYYTEKFMEHQDGPQAADWNSEDAQHIRFAQLSRLLPEDADEAFSICDFGCGLGDYQVMLEKKYKNMSYTGIDVSSEIIEKAKKIRKGGEYLCGSTIEGTYDYIVSSGIFNVRQDTPEEEWKDYILSTITMFSEHALKGFAFNCLTKYSDADRMQDYLYYADPLFLFDHCKKNFSRNVALLHDYEIYDFTMLVRR